MTTNEARAAHIARSLKASNVPVHYLHSAARARLDRKESTRDSLVIADAKKLQRLVQDTVKRNELRAARQIDEAAGMNLSDGLGA